MVHVAFEGLRSESVDALLVRDGAQRGSREDLGLASREEAGAVRARYDRRAACDVSDLVQTPAVGPHAFVDDHRAQFVFLTRLDAFVELLILGIFEQWAQFEFERMSDHAA